MKRIALVLAAFAMLTSAGLSAQDPARLLKAAMNTEMVDGDLKVAIEQYKKVVAAGNRSLAAQALLRMADCYRKLGDGESRKIYEQILRDFSDQKEAVAIARARLGRNTTVAGPTGPSTQQVWAGPRVKVSGQVSPDGRYLSVGNFNSIEVLELSTGKVRELTQGPPDSYSGNSVFSPDGRQIAYQWWKDGNDPADYDTLRLIDTTETGTKTPRVLFDNPDASVTPYDWSRDGKWIAVQVRRKDKTAQVGLVKVDDGSLRILKSVEWFGSSTMSFSPDSAYLAYDRATADGEIDRDVFVIAVDGTREFAAVVNPGDDRVVGWTPDGERLLFRSDRGGKVDLWALRFRDGMPQSGVEFVNDFGNGLSMGLTDSGALYYGVQLSSADIFVASFDPVSNAVSSKPVRPIQQFDGFNQSPEWSSDGKQLAYVSKRDPLTISPITLVIRSMESGKVVRELKPKLGYLLVPRWSPDGRTFIARGGDLKGRSGIVKIDAATGDGSLVVPNEVCSGIPFWASEGTTFFCFDFASERIVQVDPASGEVRRAFPGTSQGNAASADGRYVIYQSRAGLNLLSLSDGKPRELIRFTQDTRVASMGWRIAFTPDSRSVVFAGTVHGESGMWIVSIDGGEPRKIKTNVDVDVDAVGVWRFNPKTWEVAFALSNRPQYEVRKMENFLTTPVRQR